ncbi:hypothetical protein PV797_04085 [Clostridiaceae bacterium M8S5]|nr:hypothetical protein PV797_04085 [Clostridiaceae bacterium M8S5]
MDGYYVDGYFSYSSMTNEETALIFGSMIWGPLLIILIYFFIQDIKKRKQLNNIKKQNDFRSKHSVPLNCVKCVYYGGYNEWDEQIFGSSIYQSQQTHNQSMNINFESYSISDNISASCDVWVENNDIKLFMIYGRSAHKMSININEITRFNKMGSQLITDINQCIDMSKVAVEVNVNGNIHNIFFSGELYNILFKMIPFKDTGGIFNVFNNFFQQ